MAIQCLFINMYSRQRPYHVECTASRPISEVKQRGAWLVLGWVTAWEHQVLLAFIYFLVQSNFVFDWVVLTDSQTPHPHFPLKRKVCLST